ncbi:MAG TPA: LPS assembly lipoprotein LptE [Syntrophales bacterium]|nr:LPS assembly lipoprotein LptE [Syntrophales bacterium]
MTGNRSGTENRKTLSRTAQSLTVLLLIALLSMPAACGYRFSPGGEWIDSRLKTVFVDNMVNTTSEPFVEIYLRNGFEDQFRKSSRFRLANSKDTADTILQGTILSLTTPPVAYDRNDKATQGRAVMTVTLLFEERDNKKKIWATSNFSGNETYQIDQANPNATSVSKTAALQKLSNDMAEKAFRNLMSGF